MGWFTRKWEPPKERQLFAIPLRHEDLIVLVQGLREQVRRSRSHWAGGHDLGYAEMLMRRAGVAAAHGHKTIPILVEELSMFDFQIIKHLDGRESLVERLLLRMHALAGMAQVKGWMAVRDATGIHWPDDDPDGAQGALEGSSITAKDEPEKLMELKERRDERAGQL